MSTQSEGPKPAATEPATPEQPLVLELRIHGVNNTPPHALLDLPQADVCHVGGDELGSFWRRCPDARVPSPNERGYAPKEIVREAYSWGSLARLSFGAGSGVVAAVVGAVTRVLWTLLLPFALTNVAYWSRRLHHGRPGRPARAGASGPSSASGVSDVNGFRPLEPGHAGGAWIFRLGGMALTLITTVTALATSVDLVAVQCQPTRSQRTRCTGLPDAVGFLDGWSMGQRMALLSLVPLLLVVGLYALSSRTRARFEQATRNRGMDSAAARPALTGCNSASPGTEPRWPILSTPGFWDHSPVSGPAAKTHLAASVVVVVGLCSQQLWEHGSGELLVEWAEAWWLWALLSLVSIGLFVWILDVQAMLDALAADVSCPASWQRAGSDGMGERCSRRADRVLTVAAFAYTFFLVGAAIAGRHDWASMGAPMTAVHLAVPVLVFCTIVLVVIALGVRSDSSNEGRGMRGSIVMGLLGMPLAAALAFLPSWPASEWNWDWARAHPAITTWVMVAIIAVTLWIAARRTRTRPKPGEPGLTESQRTGWGGRGPGVFLALGMFLGLVVVSALALTLGDRLNGDHSAGSLLGLGLARSAGDTSVDLVLPGLYGWFALCGAVGIALLGLVVVGLQLTLWKKNPDDGPWPAGRGPAPMTPHGQHTAYETPTMPGGPSAVLAESDAMARRVFAVRRTARLAHRAEPLLGLLVVLVAGAWLLLAVLRQFRWASTWAYWPNLVTAAGLVLTFIAVGVFIGGGTTASNRAIRPLGTLWDLACAVPRAAHPLGPPCYGERVVPEVLARVRWWLSEEGTLRGLSRSRRGVVLSAHSLGGVISVAAILGAPWDGETTRDGDPWDGKVPPDELAPDQQGDWVVPRMALITYGTQLRAYFSRFFPELFGPDVLGVSAAPRSHLRSSDPWAKDWAPDDQPFTVPAPLPGSVRHLLSQPPPVDGEARPRWYSLWHLTDYLGFPLVARPPRRTAGVAESPADDLQDWYAQEIDFSAYLLTVLTHSDYPRTEEYAAALQSAVADLRQ